MALWQKGCTVTDEEINATLLAWRDWIRIKASYFPPIYPSRTDELAQEGWTKLWEVLRGAVGGKPSDEYLRSCILNHMRNVYNKRLRQQHNEYVTWPVDMTPGAAWQWDDELWNQVDVDLTGITEAYHDGRLAEAVSRLPVEQRGYVMRRFWHGWTRQQLRLHYDHPDRVWAEAQWNIVSELIQLEAAQ